MGDTIEFPANGHTCSGYVAVPPGGKGPALLVIQEWWGLVDHIEDVCDRFAAEGYLALAPDLYHGTQTKSPDQAGKLLMALNIAKAGADLRGAADALLHRRVVDDPDDRFRPEYGGGGEDVDFFRRAIAAGRRFVWCADAAVSETVPEENCNRRYLLKRALRRGRHPYNQQAWPVATSVVAVPLYAIALPVLLLFGQHIFLRYLIKECDHLGRLFAVITGRRGTAAEDRI